MQERQTRGEPFFFWFSLLLFAIIVIGFPVHALVNPDKLPPMRPVLHLHAVSLGAWYALMVLQTSLIGRGAVTTHKTLGALSLALVAIMLPTGMFVSWENMQRDGPADIFNANLVAVVVFLIHYGAALATRGTGDLHKRFMVFAGIALMLPALARWTYIFGLSPFLVLPLWMGLVTLIVSFDLITARKIKRATAIGLGVFVVHLAILFTVSSPPESEALSESSSHTGMP